MIPQNMYTTRVCHDRTRLALFCCNTNTTDVNSVTEKLTTLITKVADNTLRTKTNRVDGKAKKQINKDRLCQQLKRQFQQMRTYFL